MRTVTINRTIPASSKAIWEVLANFPNIADWNGGIKKSWSTGDQNEGVGASRHCDLKPAGALEETIAEWIPEQKLVVNIDSAKKLPIKNGVATFELTGQGESKTEVQIDYDYAPKWNLLDKIIGGALDKQFMKGFSGFFDDLEVAVTAPAAGND